MLKNILFAGAASALMIGSAQAAEIIEPTAYDWTGGYVGLQGGFGWGENDVKNNIEPVLPGDETRLFGIFDTDDDAIILDPQRDGQIGMDGWLGGAHAGYNWQADSLVFGLEGDIEFADLSGETDILEFEGVTGTTGEARQDIDWLGSIRLRLGYAMDRALIYATGGLAVGDVEVKVRNFEIGNVSESDTSWGWTLGGGFEYAFTDDLSARIEYRYTDLGDTDVDTDSLELPGSVEFENAFHAVRVGLSWRFGNLY